MTALPSGASIHLDALREVLTAADPDLDAAQRHVMALAGLVRAARSGGQRHGVAAELSALGDTVEAAFRRANDPESLRLLADALTRVIRLTYIAQRREPAQPAH